MPYVVAIIYLVLNITNSGLKMREQKNISELSAYIQRLYSSEDELLEQIRLKAGEIAKPIQIGPEEGKLLQILIKLHGASKIVEIGTLLGYSTIYMARAIKDSGKIYSIEKNHQYAWLAENNFAAAGLADKIELLEGKANIKLEELKTKAPFDMVFIDADKINYPYYLDWAYSNLAAGGILVADNTLLFDAVYQDSPPSNIRAELVAAMQEFNEALADKNKFDALLLPYSEGFSIAVKK